MRLFVPFCALALGVSPALAAEPEEKKKEEAPKAEQEKKAKDEKICRYIRMDMSSRRKEKICRTRQGWIDFNRGN